MKINLFLDANIFLSFYSLTNSDIKQLKQIEDLVSVDKSLVLFVSDQLHQEVMRNRGNKIRDSLKQFSNATFRCSAPVFARSLAEFGALQSSLKSANENHASLMSAINHLVDSNTLDADLAISSIFSTTKVRMVSDQLIVRSHVRSLRGSPPGKKSGTIGDEINWEFLLEEVPHGEDIHIVSADTDFSSAIDSNKISDYLSTEWRMRKGSSIYYYQDLNDFFRIHTPKIRLAHQERISDLITELSGSQSFFDTHTTLAKFPENSSFNDSQINELIDILENNTQVGWILDDADVSNFFKPVLDRYSEISGIPYKRNDIFG